MNWLWASILSILILMAVLPIEKTIEWIGSGDYSLTPFLFLILVYLCITILVKEIIEWVEGVV